MIRTQVYIPKALYRDIQLLAEKENKPAAEVVRDLLAQGLMQRQQDTIGESLLSLTKLGLKGPKDLSQRVDTYLYDES